VLKGARGRASANSRQLELRLQKGVCWLPHPRISGALRVRLAFYSLHLHHLPSPGPPSQLFSNSPHPPGMGSLLSTCCFFLLLLAPPCSPQQSGLCMQKLCLCPQGVLAHTPALTDHKTSFLNYIPLRNKQQVQRP
jgi:hypothetical protein